MGRGNVNTPGLPRLGHSRELRTTGVGQSKQLRRLIERFARRVVTGFAQELVAANLLHLDQHRVSAGY